MANSRGTTSIPKAYTKHNKLTIQHTPLVTLSIVLDAAKERKLPKKKRIQNYNNETRPIIKEKQQPNKRQN